MTKPSTYFLAYPSGYRQLEETLTNAVASAEQLSTSRIAIRRWPQAAVAGQFIIDPIIDEIAKSDVFIADMTHLNFNVVYELGYAIGRHKSVIILHHQGFSIDDAVRRDIGIFDTLGYQPYSTSQDLASFLRNAPAPPALAISSTINRQAPLYIVQPEHKTDDEIRLISRIKKARIQFRTFDPQEEGRLSGPKAIQSVGCSTSVITPLIPSTRAGAVVHNARCAFVAGLALGMNRDLLMLQRGEEPVPLDYRDLVSSYRNLNQIDQAISDFAPRVYERSITDAPKTSTKKNDALSMLSLGASAAENEFQSLGDYFLRTNEFERVLRGEAQLVVGRKGSGKTAMFGQVRNHLRRDKNKIVLDLKPEGFRLLQFKELVLDRVQDGTKQHIMTTFWEYLIYLEACHKLLEKDQQRHRTDHTLHDLYIRMHNAYRDDAFVSEGDFAERMSRLLDRIASDLGEQDRSSDTRTLIASEISRSIYRHDIVRLRALVTEYLAHKSGLWILFDNLDKGWPPHGLSELDVISFRALLDAISKIRDHLQNNDQNCVGVVFVRNDVYEWIIRGSSDRGKISHVPVDWTDVALLRELLRRRILLPDDDRALSFEDAWARICCSHIDGEETSQYLIERSLMRPRGLIDLIQCCRSHALNLGKTKIDVDDIREGEESYSTELVSNLSYEMRDIITDAYSVLYQLLGCKSWLSHEEISSRIGSAASDDVNRIIDLMLWYGVIGIVRDKDATSTYIYDVRYDIRRLQAISPDVGARMYCVNPALWRGLEIGSV